MHSAQAVARAAWLACESALEAERSPSTTSRLTEYFVNDQDQNSMTSTLAAVEHSQTVDVLVRVGGGGMTGQSGAVRMGLARALVSYDESLHDKLREGGFLTRDSRMKERKKPGLRGARRGVQFSKR